MKIKFKKASTKNIYFPDGLVASLSKWRITTHYYTNKPRGKRWSCLVEKKICNEWKELNKTYGMASDDECLSWANDMVISVHGVSLKQ